MRREARWKRISRYILYILDGIAKSSFNIIRSIIRAR